jgi:polar amino acid transport system permease protein
MFWQVTLELLKGFGTTAKLFALTLVFALPLGLILSFGSMSKFKPIKAIVKIFVWIIRGTDDCNLLRSWISCSVGKGD